MRFFMAKAVPYILTFLAGAGVFFFSVRVPSEWSAWLVEISGALSAIPIVFLIYDYTDYLLTRRVSQKLFDSLSFEINSVVLKIMRLMHENLGLKSKISWRVIEKMLVRTEHEIRRDLKLNKKDIPLLRAYKEQLDDLVYKTSGADAFTNVQFETVAALPRELSHIMNELEFRGSRDEMAKSTKTLFTLINNWFDSCEEEALISHEHFRLAEELAGGSGKPESIISKIV